MIRKSKTKKINESLFIDSSILGLQELKDFCNEIIDAFDEEGISCDVEWHTNGTGDIYLLGEYESILVGRVVLVNEIETEKGTVYLVDHLSGETKRVGRFFGDSSFPNGVAVFNAFDPVEVEEAIGAREPEDYDESVKRRSICRRRK